MQHLANSRRCCSTCSCQPANNAPLRYALANRAASRRVVKKAPNGVGAVTTTTASIGTSAPASSKRRA